MPAPDVYLYVDQTEPLDEKAAELFFRDDRTPIHSKDVREATLALGAAWEQDHPERPDAQMYRQEILPGLADIPLKRLMDATGLSAMGCSKIRRSISVPHPRHWEAVASLEV